MQDLLSKTSFAWALRVYFYITIVIFALSLFIPQSRSQLALDVFWVAGLVPLYGYVSQIPLVSAMFWRVYLVISIVVFLGQFAYAFYVVGAAIHPVLGAVLNGLVLAVVFIMPMWWANYLYAFRSPQLWPARYSHG
jgi:hypothetical protein